MTATEQTWADRVTRWRQSGLSADEFATREKGFKPSTRRFWASRLRMPAAVSPAPVVTSTDALRLLPVHVRAAVRELEVRLGDLVIAVPDGVDPRRVAQLVHALLEVAA